eukprot:COSAG05_NODE_20053_length_283_cov_2.244565_1_plen_25_part_01
MAAAVVARPSEGDKGTLRCQQRQPI